MIGNTPLIKIKYSYLGKVKYIYAKMESFNLTGSIKDRMADYIIKKAYESGELKAKQVIVEATSGNTGISLAALGAYYKNQVHIFMPDWVSSERKKLIELYGGIVHLVSREEGGFKECIRRADKLALSVNGFRPNQFCNQNNVLAHFEKTAPEVYESIGIIDAFVSGVGSGGTLMGFSKYFKKYGTKIFALEPSGLPIISSGATTGSHLIEGIGDDFIPEIVDVSTIDDVIVIDDQDAINMAEKLACELGLGLGISSGANLWAAILLNDLHNFDKLVTICPDDNKKYLSTKLGTINDANLPSAQVIFLDYEII